MDNSHQDPGITRGGPPGPAINPTITQEETVMEEMEELEYELNLESNWSLQPDLLEESKGVVNTPLIFSQSTNPSSLPSKFIPNQPHIQPTAPTPITNSGKEPCSDGASKTVDQFLKSSNSCRVSTINNISIKSETEDFSALINNSEDRTYLGRTLAKEYLGIKEESYQAYHQFSPPPKHPTLNISGQNKQAPEDSVTKIIPVNIPYDTGSRKFLVNNQDISLCSSHFLVGLMRPSAKLGEEDRAKALEFKIYYHYFFYQQPEDIFFITKAKNKTEGDHVQESVIIQTMVYLGKSVLDYYELTKKPPFHSSLLRNLGDDVWRLEVNNRRVQMVSDGERWDQEYTITPTERDTEDGRGEASDEDETEIGRERGMATIEDGGNCPRTLSIYIPNDSRRRTHPLRRGGVLRFISKDGRCSLEQRD
ncbi:hypothetical protein KEM48_013953 [Puccinia striiformis f. sp. tritici PST-130]|nr:hypothetical protein KEM48_013953 [Puccinia striiformis f. sp. tritici PST-130]